jgi:hypothetical protein
VDTLLLNSDAQPVSLLPLSAIEWKEAITYLWLDKVTVLEWYDDWIVRSENWETRVPAVIMLKKMMKATLLKVQRVSERLKHLSILRRTVW